jgi:hypothetical protein
MSINGMMVISIQRRQQFAQITYNRNKKKEKYLWVNASTLCDPSSFGDPYNP